MPRLPTLTTLLVLALAGPAAAAPLPAHSTAVVSGTADLREPLPLPANAAFTDTGATDETGERVVFASTSDGLVGDDDDDVLNVYARHDDGPVTLVSRASGVAGEPAHASCGQPVISDDGRRVAFTCLGSLDPADTNETADVYARDLVTGETMLVSRAAGQGPVANDPSLSPSISADGSFVAFASSATNLAPVTFATSRIYRRHLDGDREIVLISATTTTPVEGSQPSIDDSGRRVAFVSPAPLAATDNNGRADVYVRDTAAQTMTLVSRASGAAGPGNDESFSPVISGDGTVVGFTSWATDLVPADTTGDQDAYLRVLAAGTTRLLTTAGVGGVVALSDDADDRLFWTDAPLDAADTGTERDLYIEVRGLAPELLSRGGPDPHEASQGALSGNGGSAVLSLFYGATPDVDRHRPSVAVVNLKAGTTTTASRPAGSAPFRSSGGVAVGPAVSADGRFVAFVTDAPALAGDGGQRRAVVRDTVTGAVTIASRADGPDGPPLRGRVDTVDISADGRRVAFTLRDEATASPSPTQVYVRDLVVGRTHLASRADGGAAGSNHSYAPSLSADGRAVAFVSNAPNLGDGDTDELADVHVHLVDAGRTVLASRADGTAGEPGNRESNEPRISGDGRFVVFTSGSSNLGDGDADTKLDVHVRDLVAGRTILAGVNGDGVKADTGSLGPSIDASGTRVAFISDATNLLGLGQPADYRLYVRDLATGRTELAGRADGAEGFPVDARSLRAEISADGRSVAFVAVPTAAIAPGAPADGVPRVFVRDLVGGVTELVSRASGPDGAPSAPGRVADWDQIEAIAITADGACVAFSSRQHDLISPAATSDMETVYLRARRADCGRPTAAGPGADRTAPRLTGVRLTNRRFRVGRRATALAAAARRGTVLRFRLSEPATVSVRVERQRRGHRRGGRCAIGRGRRPCVKHTRAGVLRRVRAGGPGRIAFSGRLGRKRLAPGSYRLVIRATDAAGNVSAPVRRGFRIVS